MEEVKKAFTHGGRFHADDVFSAALLRLLFTNIEIVRGFKVPENFEGLVFDIGFGKFDHHQMEQEVRENGVPYAAFGLLWREFGNYLVPDKMVESFDEKFVQPLDYSDNMGEPNEIANLISIFNTSWDEEDQGDENFFQAVSFAECILKRHFIYMQGKEKADLILDEVLKDGGDEIVILPRFVPWKKRLVETDAKFVVYPSARGGYNAQGVPINAEIQDIRVPFPIEWRGKTKEELIAVSGVETLSFCHAAGFLAATDTLEDAIRICKLAIDNLCYR